MDLNLGDTQTILSYCRRSGLTRPQTAYVLATTYWETARTMKPVREAFWMSEEWRKANHRYWPYDGRGYVQLTWKDNYERAGKVVGVDLVDRPERAMEPRIATIILVRGMMEGWFTGKALPQYVNQYKVDFLKARRVVNGTDKAAEIAKLAEEYLTALPPERAPGFLTTLAQFIEALFRRKAA